MSNPKEIEPVTRPSDDPRPDPDGEPVTRPSGDPRPDPDGPLVTPPAGATGTSTEDLK